MTAWLLFHGLDISAVLVLAGIALSLWRRMTDKGARTLQQFGMDFLPIILLFAISVTGLALTVSQEWLRGSAYSFLAILHAITVIAALLFLPFGKFFHIFQRPAQLGVKLYQEAGAAKTRARTARAAASASPRECTSTTCARCCRSSASTTPRPGPAGHWQALCPACKRKSLSTRPDENQGGITWLKRRVRRTSCTSRFGPHLNYTPPGGWQDESRQARREAGEDPLLLLRPAMRHPTQGPRQPRDRASSRGRSSRSTAACFAPRA